jgi:hypothetical protein
MEPDWRCNNCDACDERERWDEVQSRREAAATSAA